MTELLPFLQAVLGIPGLSGHESSVARYLEGAWRPLVDELSLSRLGSLHGLKSGQGPAPRPSVALVAHMDSIGLIVTRIAQGFLYVGPVGELDPRVLPGQAVTVHSRQDLPGVIVAPPSRLLPPEAGSGTLDLPYLLVDVGLEPDQVSGQVRVGDLVSFQSDPVELAGGVICGRALDNRVSVAAVTLCLEELLARRHAWDVWAVASVQEEIDFAGAATSAFELRPSIAVAVDVTFGRGPGADGWQTFPLDQGPTLAYGPNIHPALYQRFRSAAGNLEMPVRTEYMPVSSDTDGMALQVALEGIPTMVASIPIRYMHTPVELAALQDIRRAGRLLAEFVATLEADFLQNLSWEG